MWASILLAAGGDGKPELEGELAAKAASWSLVIGISILLIALFVGYLLLLTKIHTLPESVAVILLGIFVGLGIKLSGKPLQHLLRLDPKTFFLYFLPPLMFECGYSLQKSNFFSNIGSILLFAVAGTTISTVIVGYMVYIAGAIGLCYALPLIDSMSFGALISAVDPVATLAIFRALHVRPTLYMLVLGESALNDAVAIVLFRAIQSARDDPTTVMGATASFFAVSLGSVLIGIIVALLSALIFKISTLYQFPTIEFTMYILLAYFPYVLAEGANLSGILAIFFCGLVMSKYAHCNVSPTTQVAALQCFRMIAYLSETVVFLYLGLAMFTRDRGYEVGLIFIAIIAILVGRAANIFPLARFANRFRRIKIPKNEQVIMWFSGLRGAIAFALALNIESANAEVIISTVLVTVLVTVLGFGGGTLPMLKLLRIERLTEAEIRMSKNLDGESGDGEQNLQRRNSSADGSMLTVFERLDNEFLSPIFKIPERDATHSAEAAVSLASPANDQGYARAASVESLDEDIVDISDD